MTTRLADVTHALSTAFDLDRTKTTTDRVFYGELSAYFSDVVLTGMVVIIGREGKLVLANVSIPYVVRGTMRYATAPLKVVLPLQLIDNIVATEPDSVVLGTRGYSTLLVATDVQIKLMLENLSFIEDADKVLLLDV